MKNKVIKCGNINISNTNSFTLIAGPCQLETEKHAIEVANTLKEITQKLNIGLIYKTSFDKANRTSLSGKRGAGLEKSLPDNISISNLPDDYQLSEGQIRQFKFYFSCDNYAPYQIVNAIITTTSSLDSQLSVESEFSLIIAKQSDLQYGVNGDSQFVVDPGIRTNLAVNMTNYGLFEDNVSFSIQTNSNWVWGWTMNNTVNQTSYEYFTPNQLSYIYL